MIEDHQDLLERYFYAEKVCISEYSASIKQDTIDLVNECDDYASRFGLDNYFLSDEKDRLFNE